MAVPPAPPPIEQLGRRPFSFYPPIQNIPHNEWIYVRATWSEALVRNTASNEEIWIQRRFLGQVSRVDEPVMIVGLIKELEFKAGALWPAERRVIEMPRAVNDVPSMPSVEHAPRPAPVIGIRLEDNAESRVGRVMIGVISLGIVGCVLAVSLYRGGILGNRVIYAPVMQSDLGLGPMDDYYAVVRLLGEPAEDRWRTGQGAMEYRLLGYPKQGFYIILMGRERKNARYIGALDRNWKPVHSVDLPGRVNSYSMLRSLRRF